ncbi:MULTISPECIES: hypothetical protein [Bosea]|jgi:hypothetical protein|nr:hypothetical protein [Bosea vaviloviae]
MRAGESGVAAQTIELMIIDSRFWTAPGFPKAISLKWLLADV